MKKLKSIFTIHLSLLALVCLISSSTYFLKYSELLNGEWRFDSASTKYSHNHSLIIDDSKFYEFSWSVGGGLVDFGEVISGDTIQQQYSKVYYELLDSNNLKIIDWRGTSYFYKRSTYGDYKEELKEYLQGDSLRNQILGWWQVIEPRRNIDLINSPDDCKTFTLNIRDDGEAIFFRDNYLDSAVYYHYRMNPESIDFNRGCVVGSNSKISVDKNGIMSLNLGRYDFDTLKLKRIYKIE
ncbi:hypothetical protein [Chondrinema litorale]|uniref:hypothetical protein n=1 Tax=Chondrinema litorale TaxID=2994555 RepID=UPI0025437434|nr:hypothetical protein [Chondrinema litorale]UZR96780.1 hypothetical protein OQ292_24070 [Chondrinema litorale]